jgi:thioredoxin-related protein
LKPGFSFCIIVGVGCLLSLPGYMKDAMYVEIGTQRADKRIKELKKIEEMEKKNS